LAIEDFQLKGEVDCLVKHENYNVYGYYNNIDKSFETTIGYLHQNPGTEVELKN
jgi:hypothetical protein